jgi:2,3-bisphosphoglycerate-dependent phosphoglycerate mutase
MEVLLIRHGEPAWDRDGLSVDNPSLTRRGHHQAQAMAEHLAGHPGLGIDEIWVSPLARAQETAAPLAARTGIEPRTLDWLAEIGAPRFQGTPTEAVAQVFAQGWARPLDDLWDGLPGGESFRAFHHRVVTGMTGALASMGASRLSDDPALWHLPQPERRVAIVAHGGTNATAIAFLLGIPPVPWEWLRFVTAHASLSVLAPLAIADGHAFSLHPFGSVSHLPADLHTV